MLESPPEGVAHRHDPERLAVRLDIEYRFSIHALHPVEHGRKGHELDK